MQLSPLTDQWTLPASTPEIDSLLSMRADASGAYIIGVREGNSFLRKIASDNASSLWTVVRPIGTLERISIDADGNPVVLGSGVDEVSTLEKFDSATVPASGVPSDVTITSCSFLERARNCRPDRLSALTRYARL